jgi:hypothetical protein
MCAGAILLIRPVFLLTFGFAAIASPVVHAKASVAGNFESMFKSMETRLCQSIPSRKCKRARSQRHRAVAARRKEAPVSEPVPQAEAPSQKAEIAPKWKSLPPIPKRKPAVAAMPKEDQPHETVIAMTPAPLPPEKPDMNTISDQEAAPPLPKAKPAARIVVKVPEEEAAQESTNGSCYSKLKALEVDFLPQAAGRGSCRVDQAVMLRSISAGGRDVKLPDRPIVNCAFALEFSQWVKGAGVPLAKLYTGPGYQCRSRNGDGSGKLSEHARGNAVDVERLQMADGTTMWVKEANGNRTLKAMRVQACEHFTTVLGPGSNSAHAEHFHLDLERRRRDYRICE